MKIIVFGAGAWGTALAVSAAARHEVTLWARDAGQAQALRGERENRRYLPGVALPADLAVSAEPYESLRSPRGRQRPGACRHADGGAARDALAPARSPRARGLAVQGLRSRRADVPEGLLGHEVKAQVAPGLAAGVLSGPSFAQEVARGQPTALVAASGEAAGARGAGGGFPRGQPACLCQ